MKEAAFKDGIKESKIQIAKNAISMGLDIQNIIELTGLSENDLENLGWERDALFFHLYTRKFLTKKILYQVEAILCKTITYQKKGDDNPNLD